MRFIERTDIMDYQTYAENRESIRKEILKEKADRRIHFGKYLTFLFENEKTLGYQIQEIMRVEHIVKESDILHEIDTYNSLLSDKGELCATLLIEIPSEEERDIKLRKWTNLLEEIYMELEDGSMVRPSFDESQKNEKKISAVQYLKFNVYGKAPIAIHCKTPDINLSFYLSPATKDTLMSDINS